MKRRKKNSWPRIFGLAIVVLIAGWQFLPREGVASTEAEPETVRVRLETLDRTVAATGVIRPRVGAEIDVGSRVSGIVRSIPVKVGDEVGRGELLARIDPTEFQAQIAQARADLELAEAELALAVSTHQRARELAPEGIISTTELESATRDLDVVRARIARERTRVRSAEIQLSYTEIHAPIAGVIADVTTREGETVAASFAAPTFVTIVDLERLEVQAYVDETDIGRIFAGQLATFTVDTYPDAEFTATVTAINPKASLQNGIVDYIVLLNFERQDGFILRPEMTAHVLLQLEQRSDTLTLPRTAIRRRSGQPYVTVLRAGAWTDQVIETGWRTDQRVEVRDGLSEGETIQLNQE